MKITISKQGLEPMEIDIGAGCYIDLAGEVGMRTRQPVELVSPDGIIGVDMDPGGLVAGIDIKEMDPVGRAVFQLIQPSPRVAGPDGKCIVEKSRV